MTPKTRLDEAMTDKEYSFNAILHETGDAGVFFPGGDCFFRFRVL